MTFRVHILFYLIILLVTGAGCSKSNQNRRPSQTNHQKSYTQVSKGKTTVKMQKSGGVYLIPTIINGSNMNFIFDTGASDITISMTEALFLLKQGTLSEEDILGTQQYRIADGSISEGTVINLKTVKIGNVTLNNVKASVIHNMDAPLLLGQSALAQFGKVTIDYGKDEIIFE